MSIATVTQQWLIPSELVIFAGKTSHYTFKAHLWGVCRERGGDKRVDINTSQWFWTLSTKLTFAPFVHTYFFSILPPHAMFIFPVPDPFCCKNEVGWFGHRGGCGKTSDLFKPRLHIHKRDVWEDKATFGNRFRRSIKKKKKKTTLWTFTYRFWSSSQICKLIQHHSRPEHKSVVSTIISVLSCVCTHFISSGAQGILLLPQHGMGQKGRMENPMLPPHPPYKIVKEKITSNHGIKLCIDKL